MSMKSYKVTWKEEDGIEYVATIDRAEKGHEVDRLRVARDRILEDTRDILKSGLKIVRVEEVR
jgi:hypothetical protein